jgi:arsenate reductase
VTKRLHWSFPDPAALTGTDEEKRQEARKIRDSIRKTIEEWAPQIGG